MSNSSEFLYSQGQTFFSSDANFSQALAGVVDYRGDVSVKLKNGKIYVGYVFSVGQRSLDMFPRDSSRKESVEIGSIAEIVLSGEDTSKGKSWEDWVKKKAAEKAERTPESNVSPA